MKLKLHVFSFLCVLFPFVANCYSIGSSLNGGKSCSIFDFEQNVLEKLVRIEHAMEINKDKLEGWEHNIKEEIKLLDDKDDRRTSKVQVLQVDIQTQLRNQKMVLADMVDDYKKDLDYIMDNFTLHFENVTRNLVDESAILLKEIAVKGTKSEEMAQHIEDNFSLTLQSLIERAENNLINQQQLVRDSLLELQKNTTLLGQQVIEQQIQANNTIFKYVQKTADAASGKNRVAVTMCPVYGNPYTRGSVIPFNDIKTMNGINTTGLDSIKSTGKFTCESSGLYLISVFIMSSTHKSYVTLYKDSKVLAYIFYSLHVNEYSQTNAVTVLEKLNVHNSIFVKAGKDMSVDGGAYSCMSVLQIN